VAQAASSIEPVFDIYTSELGAVFWVLFGSMDRIPVQPTVLAGVEFQEDIAGRHDGLDVSIASPFVQEEAENDLAWESFRQGYGDRGGVAAWEDHFVDDVLPCEAGRWTGYYGPPVSRYISRAQFHPGSWATTTSATGLSDPDNPYHVGANVAWWSRNISHPGSLGGWAECWKRGTIP
jgi:hypothetical protein